MINYAKFKISENSRNDEVSITALKTNVLLLIVPVYDTVDPF